MRISAPVQQKLDLIEASSTRMIMAYSKILREGKPPLKKVKAVGVALKHYQQEELALLTRTQRARLLELSLQEGDASELEDPSVAKALGLSRSQVEALDRADGAEVGKMLRTLPKDPSEKLKWYMSAQKTRQANIDEAVQKILTVPQMRAWTKMKGRPLPMFEAKSVRSTM